MAKSIVPAVSVTKNLSVEDAATLIKGAESKILFHQSQLVLLRWMQGKVVAHMDKSYGTGAVDKLSEKTGIHRNILKLSERLYHHFSGSERLFTEWVDAKARQWQDVEGLLRASTDPAALGMDAFRERIKRRIERMARDMATISDNLEDGSDEEAEVSGLLLTATEEVARFRQILEQTNKQKVPRSDEYLDFVRAQPCVVCGTEGPSEPHHVDQGGVGKKGSDLSCISLCHEHHRFLEDNGHAVAEDELGFSVTESIATLLHEYLTGQPLRLPRDLTF